MHYGIVCVRCVKYVHGTMCMWCESLDVYNMEEEENKKEKGNGRGEKWKG